MHDTLQLRQACRTDEGISPYFWDVFGADEGACQPTEFPKCAIWNTDPLRLPGQHWIAVFWTSQDHGEVFDSYARAPSFYNAAWRCFDPFRRIPQELQGANTDVCGDYCLYYLFHRCRGKTMTQIVRPFSHTDRVYNDTAVVERVREEFPSLQHQHLAGGLYDENGRPNQLCRIKRLNLCKRKA